MVFQTIFYENYAQASLETGILTSFAILSLIIWRYLVEYKAAETVFKVSWWKGLFWFFVLPAGFSGVYLVMLVATIFLAS